MIRNQEFWQRIKRYADEKLKKLQGGGHRCPNCLRWTWQMEKRPTYLAIANKPEFYLTCGDCGYKSRWFDTGFVGLATVIGSHPAEERSIKCD